MGILQQLKEAYQPKKYKDQKESSFIFSIYRPLSFYLAVPFAKSSLSTNQVAQLGSVISLAGIILIAVGGYGVAVIGSLFYFLGVLMDFVDGNLARLRGESNHFAKFMDGVRDTFVASFFPMAVGFGLYRRPDHFLVSWFGEASGGLILLAGAITALAVSLQVYLVFRLRAARSAVQVAEGGRPANISLPKFVLLERPGILGGILRALERAVIVEPYFMYGGVVLFALADGMSIFLFIHGSAYFINLLFTFFRTVHQARRDLNVYR